MSTLVNLIKDESGASAAEYALILAIVGSGLAAAALFLGGAISNAMKARGNQITACQSNAAACG